MFSRRLHWDLSPNLLSTIVESKRAAGEPLLDLTLSNPTRAGFDYPRDWQHALLNAATFSYDPTPQGLLSTREAVARYYAAHGATVDPADIFLTASTSEAYAYLFKLLTDPGDEILVPQPSYPLFEFLASLEHTAVHPYPAQIDDVTPWRAAQTRALVAVHPNNPTGECFSPRLARSCAEQGLPVIVDEVFLDYAWRDPIPTFAATRGDATVFILSGLSKICGLPQMKLGWIVIGGPQREAIRQRLELIADTYLSASTPVQAAAIHWLDHRHEIQGQIQERIRTNLAALDASPLARRACGHGGWTAVVELPEDADEETFAVRLASDHGVVIQPGYFYDFEGAPVAVVSLLTPPATFAQGLACISTTLSDRTRTSSPADSCARSTSAER